MKPLLAQSWTLSTDLAASSRTAPDARSAFKTGGQLQLSFLSPTLARVTVRPPEGFKEPYTWAIAPVAGSDVPWSGRPREDMSGFDRPELTVSHGPAGVTTLSSQRLSVSLLGDGQTPLRLLWVDTATGKTVLEDRPTSAYLQERRTDLVRHCVVRDPREHFYGLGDKTGPLNLHGRRLRCLGQDALGYDPQSGDPLYKHWPFVMSRTVDGLWVGLYYDTLSTCIFDLGCEHDNYHGFFRTVDIDDGDLDYYLMLGQTPAEVLAQFVKLIGGTHLPPRWSLGYAQTAMGLADAPDAQQQLDRFIDLCASQRIPISSFHYGSGYSSRGKQRYVFTWNHGKFPDPQAINQKFQSHGMRLVANIKPCLLDDHPSYQALNAQHAFIEDHSTGQAVVEPYWDGQGSHLDFTRPQAVAWWQEQLKRQVLGQGIDAGWNDNNEYAIQNEDAYSEAWGARLPMHRSRPLHALLMTRATFEAQKAHAPEAPEATFTVTRAGPPGLQRYAQTWSGDNTTSWATLKWNVRTGLQMSLSGMFNVGHDVGGFYGPLPEPELFLRWVQACCLNPRMVMNSWKEGGISNLPWMHPEVTDAVRDAIALRYRLMPYLWACFERAAAQHEPIIRPTFFNFPDDVQCLEDSDEFMLGQSILVSPVVAEGQREKRVYMPQLSGGRCWVDFHTHQRLACGSWHTVPAPLSHLPMFVAEGAKIAVASALPGQLPRHDDPVSEVLQF
jgi:alpha-glucosidase